jgi:hypothetical protein
MAAGELARQQVVRARIARVRRRLNLPVWLAAAVGPAWVAVTAFVVWRVFVQRALPVVALLALALVVVATALRARARRVSLGAAAVITDRQAGLGGLLLTRLEVPVGGWELDLNTRLKGVRAPEVSLRRPLGALVGAVAFLVAGLLVPKAEQPVRARNAAAATRVDVLADKLEALAREEPSDLAAQQELGRLQDEVADGAFDATDWEAADALDKALDGKAQQAAAELARAEAAAAALSDAVARAQSDDGAARERDELERALMDLEASAGADDRPPDDPRGEPGDDGAHGQAGESGAPGESGKPGEGRKPGALGQSGESGRPGALGQSGEGGRPGALGQSGEGGKPSESGKPGEGGKPGESGAQGEARTPGERGTPGPRSASSAGRAAHGDARSMSGSQADALRRALERRRQRLASAFGQEGRSGSQRSGARRSGRSTAGASGASEAGEKEGEARLDPARPGHLSHQVDPGGATGPSQGGGPGALQFGGEASMDPERLQFEPLPKGQGGDAEALYGLRAANPRVKQHPISAGTGAGAVSGDQAPGPGAAPLLPRNRALIERYFDSKR